MEKISGFVLAGGVSSRLKQNKALVKYNGLTMIEHAINILKHVCSNVFISSNEDIYNFTGCEIWKDKLNIKAPMIGIYSCLLKTKTEKNIFISCDMPHINIELLKLLIQKSDGYSITVPVHNKNKIEPLCGIYLKDVSVPIEKLINADIFKIIELFNLVSSKQVMINKKYSFYHPDLFLNINTPKDMERLKGLTSFS